jgi:microcystin-dependent protein
MFSGASAPTGYLLCDGAAVSRVTYLTLFTVTGVTYGSGDGVTTFNLPDLQTRVPVGKNASGTFATLGATGGAETHTLLTAEIPSHTHTTNIGHGHADTLAAPAHTHNIAHGHADTLAAPAHTHNITNRPTVPGGITGNTVESFTTGTGTERTIASGAASATALTGSVTALGTTASGAASATTLTGSVTDLATTNVTSTSAGSDSAHNNLQPYIVLNYIIKV